MELVELTNSAKQSAEPAEGVALIHRMLEEQQSLTAVERFALDHDADTLPAQERYYRNLIPLEAPGPGQQLAFEVDLDSCTGCKACVVACHNLNGLDDTEAWRDVGMLHGGTVDEPILQTVTTACHHCVEPACMSGCPVNAFEKDPVTGIVKHLDDQCIGCQYCILKCPYDVPKFNKEKGIVRKCDMCSDRLEVGEAPACVQSCPNQAIRITVVDQAEVIENSEASTFLPGAPDPGYTLPTTNYKTERVLPRNMLPADHYEVRKEHAHMPLVIMLVLTQMSVGAFVVEQLLRLVVGGASIDPIRPFHAISALGLGLLALAASTLHLGRPLYAFRAIVGLRTSWLSREILAFGVFAKLAMAYAAVSWFWPSAAMAQLALGVGVCVVGIAGVFCSIMIYHDTRREFWNLSLTAPRFMMTAAVLGLPVALATGLATAAFRDELTVAEVMVGWGLPLCGVLIGVSIGKLLFEATFFTHLRDVRHTPMKRTAILMAGHLADASLKRFIFGGLGGIVCPALLLVSGSGRADGLSHPAMLAVLVGLSLVLCLLGEMYERYLFFTAVVSPKMPGGQM
jgi:formate dehydrogenase iron-sulfur subunit